MVEVFRTNISEEKMADSILQKLVSHLPESYVNFDLEDCDRILRIENCTVHAMDVIQIVKQNGFECELLE